MTPTPAVINVPPTKAALAAEVENILGRLRRGYISQLHAPSLPPIEPEVWAANRRAGWLACLQDPAPEKAPPGPGAQLFPSAADFDALDQSVEILARAMGVRRFRHQDRLQIYRRVEHDYPRLKVIGFAHDLARRIGSVPEPPLTKLAKLLAVERTAEAKKIASGLYLCLGGNPRQLGGNFQIPGPSAKIDWEACKPWLLRLTSPSFNQAMPSHGAMSHLRYAQFAFRDVLCQQQLWRASYGALMDATAQWLYGLHDPKIDEQLRGILHGPALRPEAMRSALRQLAARVRSRSYRERQKDPPKFSPIP